MVHITFGVGPNSLAAGEAKRCRHRTILDLFPCLGRILVGDARRAQSLADAPRAVAAPLQRAGAGDGEGGVVDIAEARHPLDEAVDGGRALPVPAALLQLPGKIGLELGPAGRVATDIVQGQPL